MSRSNPSERRSRRRASSHPATSFSSPAEKRRKRRLASNRRRSAHPNAPMAPTTTGGSPQYRRTQQSSSANPSSSPTANNNPSHYLPPTASSRPRATPPISFNASQSHTNPPYADSSYGASSFVPPQVRPGTSLDHDQDRQSQGIDPNGTPRSTTRERDIRFGPSPRRRHALSSNPAFGQPRNRQRSGPNQRRYPEAEPGYPPDPQPNPSRTNNARINNSRTVDLAVSAAHPSQLSKRPGSRQTRSGQTRSGQSVRTQVLQPQPVSSPRSRSRTQPLRGRTSPSHAKQSFAPSQSRAIVKAKTRRRPPKPVSPIVYGLRLLILGTGVGVIAGTVISAMNPARTVSTVRDSTAMEDQAGDASGESTATGLSNMGEGFPVSELAAAHLHTVPKQQPYIELARQLEQMGQAQAGLLPGVFVLDMDTNNYVDLNGNMSFSAASTIKVPVLVAFFQDVEQNKIDLGEMLTMAEEDVASGSGDMQYKAVGTQYTALETATKMIVISDNTATNMLIRRMGGMAALNQRFRSWGLSLTQIRNPLPDLEGTNTTSPSELTHLMALVSEGQLLSLRSRDRMLDIMSRTRTRTLLPTGIGDNAAIAHKTGDIGSMVGDTGLVDTTAGKRYAITIMMGRPHNDRRAQELIRQMAGRIHQAIQEPPIEPAPPPPVEIPDPPNSPDSSSIPSQ